MSAPSYPRSTDQLPDLQENAGRYEIRYARNEEDLDQVLRLRYEVFNMELNEGLDESEESQRDLDRFDPWCHHLMIIETETGEVVGTYRMQTVEMAKSGIGFYIGDEFDLSAIPADTMADSVETGRACIARAHRNGRVLFLLWRGLGRYMAHTKKRYFFGCCSLTSQDEEEGLVVYDYLRENGHVHPSIEIPVMDDFSCALKPDHLRTFPDVKIPRLMKIYLAYGAKVCSLPARDRAFKTIDYLALLDIESLDEKTYRNLVH